MDSLYRTLSTEGPVDIKYAFYCALSSVVFFQFLNKCLSYAGSPKSVEDDGCDAVWKWNNLVISWVHGVVSGLGALLCFYLYPNMWDDLVNYVNLSTYLLLSMTVGYFTCDLYEIISSNRLWLFWEVVIHHIAIMFGTGYNLVYNTCIAYTVVALLAEVNTVFLHTRKLLQLSGYSFDHWLYRTAVWLNIITFLIFRLGSNWYIDYNILFHSDTVSRGYFYIVLCPCWSVLSVINPVLLWRLVKNDVLRPSKNLKSSVNGNNNLLHSHAASNDTVCNGKKHS